MKASITITIYEDNVWENNRVEKEIEFTIGQNVYHPVGELIETLLGSAIAERRDKEAIAEKQKQEKLQEQSNAPQTN